MKPLVFLILSLSLLVSAESGVEGNQFSVSISGSDGKPVPDSQVSLITNDGMIRQKGVAGADGLFTFEKPNKSSVLFAAAPYHESARLRYEGQGIVLMTLKASPDKSSIISEGYTRLLGREGYIFPYSKTFMRSDGITFRSKETQVTYSVGGIIIATDTKGERFKIYVKEAIHPLYLIEYTSTSPKVSQVETPSLVSRPIPQKSGSVYLCDLPVVSAQAYRFVKGNPEKWGMNGRAVLKGLLAWSPSEIVYDLTGLNAVSLEGSVGIAPANENSSMRFEVYGDDKVLWQSAVMTQDPKRPGTSLTENFKVDVSGIKILKLKVDPLGSNNSDHATWIDPRLRLTATANEIKSTSLNEIKLTSLTPKDYSVGYADLFVGHNVGNFEVYLRGNPCKDYIFAHAPSRILYDIPGAATTFSAYGIRPAGDENIAGSWIYIVRIDGKEVFKSKSLSTYPKLEVPIVVPIPAGSREIELIIDPIKNNFADHSIWAKPIFK